MCLINHFNLIRPYAAFRVGGLGFRFALDVANGLHCLHNFTDPTCVYKRICSSIVLLNRYLRDKIGSFSLAYSLKEEEYTSSSMTYTAPEYIEYGLVTPEIDTYRSLSDGIAQYGAFPANGEVESSLLGTRARKQTKAG
ncbi:hypothetical protein SADUNF_Sadunf07G0029300 [Salix dunnii]|uniref:Serine-threonine/tyrosine-protein kinase catalytic domain-containing protein n=1 Tax=Salix dunnii TaxID=1413687 RepID=A0A835N263_9ROSI|nr:hypothetical protein SADUNF_Sadunf07G0029300 [Salix dunnii]